MIYAAALALTLNVAVLLLAVVEEQDAFAMLLMVRVVEPEPDSSAAGIVNVPLEAPIVSVAVLPVDELAPLKAKVTVNVPAPRVVLFTVAVALAPAHTVGTLGDVKLVTFGFVPTWKVAVLLADGLEEQPPCVMLLIVTVVAPLVGNRAAGMVNVPLVAPIVSVAVLFEDVLAPLSE